MPQAGKMGSLHEYVVYEVFKQEAMSDFLATAQELSLFSRSCLLATFAVREPAQRVAYSDILELDAQKLHPPEQRLKTSIFQVANSR